MFGKKKNLYGNDMYVYSVFDSVSKLYRGTFYHNTDAEMIKVSLPSLLMEFALRDISIYRIGIFNTATGEIKPTHKIKIPLDSYTFPHSRLSSKGDDLTLEEVEEEMKKTKNELVAKLNSSVNDKEEIKEEEVINE